jgi:uncharacterized membrane protein
MDVANGVTNMNEGQTSRTTVWSQRWRTLLQSRFFVPICLVFILVLGAYFRFTGVNWDDYTHLHPDERFVWMVEISLTLPKSLGEYFNTAVSPLNPYNHGSSFIYGTLPLFLTKIVGQVLRVSGDHIHLLGRVLAGLFDLVTVWLMFLIGRKLYGERVGLLAAFLSACLVIHIQQAHFFTADSFVATFVVLTFYWALRVAERGSWSDFVWMGLSYGLAVASKINVALFGAIMALACGVRIYNAVRAPVPELAAEKQPGGVVPGEPIAGDALAGALVRWKIAIGGVRIALSVEGPASETRPAVETVAAVTSEPISESPVPPSTLTGVVETVPTVTAEPVASARPIQLSWLDTGVQVALKLGLSLLVAFAAFRIVQPYTFQGPGFFGLKLSEAWLKDVRYWAQASNGTVDLPFNDYWTSRAPVLFSLENMFRYVVGVPLSLASWAGWALAWYELLRRRRIEHLLVLAWTTFFFLYQSTRFGKLSRYLTPFFPFMAMLAGYLIIFLWRKAKVLRIRWARIAVLAVVLFVLAGSFLTAFAFTRIYTRPLTRVAASLWVYDNIPAGSAIGSEHWDDSIPWGGVGGRDGYADGTYKWVEFHPYAEDEPQKLDWFIDWLNSSDYIILSSNRLYGSIPRLPMRFPMTTRYYKYLFSGDLGFELIKTFTSRPNLGRFEFVDDDAEEPFTVYDHPKVSVFKKTASYSATQVRQLLGDGIQWENIARLRPIDVPNYKNGLQLSDEEKAAQQKGGTWSAIFNRNSLSNAVPVVFWLLLVEVIGVVTLPLASLVFPSLSDRGYILSKSLGILLLAWLTWIMVSLGLTEFGRTAIAVALLFMTACSALIFWHKREEMITFWREHRALVIINEVLFLLFFLGFLLIRYGNPDLWHPVMGGEKPMDFAYLNAVIRSSTFPPYDPWFAGGYLNYYYFGQIILAVLIKFTGIVPWVAYNLSIPLLAALTAMGAFSVVYNLTWKKPRIQMTKVQAADEAAPVDAGHDTAQSGRLSSVIRHLSLLVRHSWEPAMTWGLLAALMVAVLGNLAEIAVPLRSLYELGTATVQSSIPFVIGLARVLSGLSRVLTGKARLSIPREWPYWNPSRVMPNGEINEFPFFTFLYADLHAHLIALPFTLLALGLAVAVIKKQKGGSGKQKAESGERGAGFRWLPKVSPSVGRWLSAEGLAARQAMAVCRLLSRVDWSEALLLTAMGLVVGALRPTNSWDYPTYLLVVGVALLLHEYESRRKIDMELLWAVAWRSGAVLGLSYLFFWPFLSRFSTAYVSFERWKGPRTGLGSYLGIHGLFLFLIVSWMGIELFSREVREGTVRMLRLCVRYWDRLPRLLGAYSRLVKKGRRYDTLGWVIVLPLALLALGLALAKQWFFLFVWLLILGTLLIVLRLRLEAKQRFVWLLFGLGLALSLAVDLFVLKGDIGRMNTVFKFYLQIWILWSVAAVVSLSYVVERMRKWSPSRRGVWQGILALLLFLAALYPILATKAKIGDRFDASIGPSLDGTTYMQSAVYNDGGQLIELKYDLDAINWLLDNVKGSPVIAEANTEPRGLYRWGSRVAIYTGLPTIIGWSWHQRQQRSAMPGQWIDSRLNDVARLYSDTSPEVAMEIVHRYDVRYIYVGEVERIYYPGAGLEKFERMRADGQLSLAYHNSQVSIYEVTSE